MGTIRSTAVDVQGLFRLLGENLYSTPAVAIRELVQNAHDSIVRRRIADPAWTGGTIRIVPDAARGRLVLRDDGAGLTGDEVTEHLATLGAGGTRLVREAGASGGGADGTSAADELIGMFGIGFLSAFVIADRVVVTTTSHLTPVTWRYVSKDGQRYSLDEIEPRPIGTTVELWLRPDARHLAETAELRALTARYCALLRTPVHIGPGSDSDGSDGSDDVVNGERPPWEQARSDGAAAAEPAVHPVQDRRRRLEFATRFERWFTPLVTIDVPRDPAGLVEGLVWIQDGATYGSSDNRNVSLFVNGMLVDDDARDLLPRWAGFAGAVLSSYRLQPTASREDVARTDDYRAAVAWVAEQLVAGLAKAADTQPEAWQTVLTRHNEALLGASLTDHRLFELLADDLTVPTSEGQLAAAALRRRGGGTIYVAVDEGTGFEQTVLRALGVPVASGNRYAVLPFLRAWVDARGGKLAELGTDSGDAALFRPAVLDREDVAWLTDVVADDGEEVVATRFEPAALPLAVVPDRAAAVKRSIEDDEAARRIAAGALALARLRTAGISAKRTARLYVNLDNPAVAELLATRPPRGHAAVRLLRAIKQLASGGRGDLAPALSDATDTVVHLLAAPAATTAATTATAAAGRED